MHFPRLAAVAFALVACSDDDTIGLVRFNNAADAVAIGVTAGPELGDPVERVLASNTGATQVGLATVTPGSGPIGTEHRVFVEVANDFQDLVIRARLVATGDRGEQRYRLLRDSADPALWLLDVVSYGDPGEERQDTFTFELWRAADPGEQPDIEEDRGAP
jgi:hypothetical protein